MDPWHPIKPPRLRPGDTLGLVAPASPAPDDTRIEKGVRYLESQGFRVKPGHYLSARHGFCAGTDAQRAADLNTMFRDPVVKGIFCLRGGYGSGRLLPLLDTAAIRRHPKIFVGFSDITALQLGLLRRPGLVTFSGPLVGVEFANRVDPFTEEHFWRLLTSRRRIGFLPSPAHAPPLVTMQNGRVEGRLIAGNLALILSLLGTRYLPDLRHCLLVVEDVGEHLHRVDRMWSQLRLAGLLGQLAGLVFGTFSDCPPAPTPGARQTLDRIQREVAQWISGPVARGLPYGHHPRRITLPLGLAARLDIPRGGLTILESAVV
jgi:muramoyltetrapeptide carboxypeptidase